VLGAVALGLIAHHFKWELPAGVAVGGIVAPGGALGPLTAVTTEHVQCAERAGLRQLYLSRGTVIKGAVGDPSSVVRIDRGADLVRAVWRTLLGHAV
jgi:predicted S18 family serine protease